MKKQIICMGNSYKNGGRCLAGIEVEKGRQGVLSIVKNNLGSPKWIRPIKSNGDNGLPECLVGSYKIFDILEIDIIDIVPTGAHSENVHFNQICKIGHVEDIDFGSLCDNTHHLIFGNRGKAIPSEQFDESNYSLMFLKPEDPVINTQIDDYGHEKYRIEFSYKGTRYDFPLTDTEYIHLLQKRLRQRGKRNTGELYFTVSLGVNYHDWHYKLIAGVVDLAA